MADYREHERAQDFQNTMTSEHGFRQEEVLYVLSKAEKKQSILDAISRPAEKTKPWYEYRKIFLDQKRIDLGVEFWSKHRFAIQRASEAYKVDPEIIVAIIGVETRYGGNMGSYRVLDALATLGFDYAPRADFFRKELEQFFLLAREQKLDPMTLLGSYAGAMGYGQFIPSSYRAYAVDFDNDGITDIWENPEDAIGSVANYFSKHRWLYHKQVMVPAKVLKEISKDKLNSRAKPSMTLPEVLSMGLEPMEQIEDKNALIVPLLYIEEDGEEIWLGLNNFYSITRYNRSRLYARAVWELSKEISTAYSLTLKES